MKKYEKIKSSSVKWLDDIPEHWEVKRNKNIFTEMKDEVCVNFSDYTLLSLTLNGIIPRNINGGGKFPVDFKKYKIVKKGFDIDETPRTVGLSEYDGMLTGAYAIMKVNNINARYILYYYLSLDNEKQLKPLYTGLKKTININTFQSIKIPALPRPEQDKIVHFLDWKFSLINRLIAIKKQETQVLLQLRQQLITDKLHGNSVWLKRLLKKPMQYGTNSSGTVFKSDLTRHVRITDIDSRGYLKPENAKSIELYEAAPYILEDDDILLARSGATVGKAFLYKKEYGYCAYAGYLIRVKLNKNLIIPEYFMYFTNNSIYLEWKDSVFIQSTIQNISAERYGKLPIPLPSIQNQKEIVKYLNERCGKIDLAVANKNQQIEKLKTKLISDVVTGKTDVRDIEIPEYEFFGESYDE